MIDPAVLTRIATALAEIEQAEDVRVLYACESGSRAWGFPSQDSDYDVRFLYVHPPEWYFSIDVEHRRDVIERPIANDLDVSGWDLRKALMLFRKSNPPLMEWIGSPIVYHQYTDAIDHLRVLTPEFFSPTSSLYHYLHMARGNYRDYLHGDQVWLKKYFYVLRPLLAILWIEQKRGVVPMEFQTLVDTLINEPPLKEAVKKLLERKMAGDELDRGPRIPAISDFIDREIERLDSSVVEDIRSRGEMKRLNEFFRHAVRQAWSDAR